MNNAIIKMFEKYNCKTKEDYINALKEIIQEIALLGLARGNFFDEASFYGGSALRIVYGLDRFSEDLDFSLLKNNNNFLLKPYLKAIQEELEAYDITATVDQKVKKNTTIESAFIKSNTLEHLIQVTNISNSNYTFHKNEVVKVKMEVDIDPVAGETEEKFLSYPIPFRIKVFTKPVLFAGKLHAILCRDWKGSRVKGRDFYDMLWYIKEGTKVNLSYLEKKMKQTMHMGPEDSINIELLKELLIEKVKNINIQQAKRDVEVFIKDPFAIEVWSIDFFKNFINKITNQ